MNAPRSKTLLFAEDEPELLEIYSEWFKRLGYEVLSASNGVEALSLCQHRHVDLVISDVRMAGGDGIELAHRLKTTLDASPLFVFLTGFADISDEEAYDLGACTILNKPIERKELEKAVERFLKPPEELWAAGLGFQPKSSVQKHYDSLEAALEKRELSIGRGGMFVRDAELVPEDSQLGFQFEFAGGTPPQMDGCGVLRWRRASPEHGLPAGLGIEITHLASQALDPVIEWISRARPRAFIPKV